MPDLVSSLASHGSLFRVVLKTELVLLQYKVKMVTADDEQTTDIITEGDVEETTRFCRVRWMPAYAQLTWPSSSQMSQSASRARYTSGLYFSACQHVPYVHACLL